MSWRWQSQTKINNKTHFFSPSGLEHNTYKVGAVTLKLLNNPTVSSRSCRQEKKKLEINSVPLVVWQSYLFCFAQRGGGELRFPLLSLQWEEKEKEVTFAGGAVGAPGRVRGGVGGWGLCVGGHFVAGKREAPRCDKAWRPRRPAGLKQGPPVISGASAWVETGAGAGAGLSAIVSETHQISGLKT